MPSNEEIQRWTVKWVRDNPGIARLQAMKMRQERDLLLDAVDRAMRLAEQERAAMTLNVLREALESTQGEKR